MKFYKNQEPSTKQEKSFTPLFFRQVYNISVAVRGLLITGFSFAMRCCEYVLSISRERKIKLTKLENIEFWTLEKK